MELKDFLLSCTYVLPPRLIHLRGCYNAVHSFYKHAQWWSKERIEQWQLERLKMIVSFAYENTEGYRQLYDEANVQPQDIHALEDVQLLPFTSKELLRDNIKLFTFKPEKPKDLYESTTGGSTGIPFKFYVDRKNADAEYGFMYNAWESIGWKESDYGIRLRGTHLGDEDHLMKKIGYHLYALSSSFLTEENYERYMNMIERRKATYLHVYPSTIVDLSHLMIKHHDEGRLKIKHIFLGSENLYSWQKELVKTAFPESHLMSWYGHSERAVWAPWCESEQRYHLNPFYGLTEILKDNQEIKEGQVGELVGTAFWMFGTPFIRYRTNDYAEKGPDHCEKCGRQFQLLNYVDGRASEIIISRTGRRISLTVFAGSIMHGQTFEHISQFRFIQHEAGKLQLAIIPTAGYGDADENHLHESVKAFLGDDFVFEIIKVKELSKTKSGKFTYLEQYLKVDRADNINY